MRKLKGLPRTRGLCTYVAILFNNARQAVTMITLILRVRFWKLSLVLRTLSDWVTDSHGRQELGRRSVKLRSTSMKRLGEPSNALELCSPLLDRSRIANAYVDVGFERLLAQVIMSSLRAPRSPALG